MRKGVFEALLSRLRVRQIMPFLPVGGVWVDIGCNNPPQLLTSLKDRFGFGIGVDAEVNNLTTAKMKLINHFIKKKLPIDSDTADVVIMLAVLEHMDFPKEIVGELFRITRSGGRVLLTVPAPINKPVLETLAKFHLVNPKMIAQHKHYFSKKELRKMFQAVGFKKVHVTSFQLGLNTLVRAEK